MTSVRRSAAAVTLAALVGGAAVPLTAHEITHTGTVVALKTAKYAQPDGGTRDVRELEVAVVDPKTKKVTTRVFTITATTRVTRAGKPVPLSMFTARTDEKVAVVVDHDKPGDEALRVRFEAA